MCTVLSTLVFDVDFECSVLKKQTCLCRPAKACTLNFLTAQLYLHTYVTPGGTFGTFHTRRETGNLL